MFVTVVRTLFKNSETKKWGIAFIVLTIAVSALAITGVTKAHVIPVAPILLLLSMAFSIGLAFSKGGKHLAVSLSFASLLGLQAFRFPLELILHKWYSVGTIPETMTWSGSNWDIIAGLVALVAIPFLNKSKKVAWGVQIVGFVLIINVIRVAMMSSPFPFSWPLEKPLLLIMYFPYAVIVPVFVVTALTCHLIAFRKLIER